MSKSLKTPLSGEYCKFAANSFVSTNCKGLICCLSAAFSLTLWIVGSKCEVMGSSKLKVDSINCSNRLIGKRYCKYGNYGKYGNYIKQIINFRNEFEA